MCKDYKPTDSEEYLPLGSDAFLYMRIKISLWRYTFLSYIENTEVIPTVGLMQITRVQGVLGSVKETGYRLSLPK
jgi:hypothetical protein